MGKSTVAMYFVFSGSDNEMHDRTPIGLEAQAELRKKRSTLEREGLAYQLIRDFEYDGTGAGAYGPAEFPPIVRDLLMVVTSSGLTTAFHHLVKNWIDSRNGRKIKLRIRDIEVEATQMTQDQFLKFFEVIRQLDRDEQVRAALERAGFEITKK